MPTPQDIDGILLKDLTDEQKAAVKCDSRRLLLVAGAGSGKTEVIARRVAWWAAVNSTVEDHGTLRLGGATRPFARQRARRASSFRRSW